MQASPPKNLRKLSANRTPPHLTRKLSGKAFIPRSAITIKIVNKYIHHPKIAALKIVQNMPNKY